MKNRSIIAAALSACIALSLCACSFFSDSSEPELERVEVTDLREDINKALDKDYPQFEFREGLEVRLPDEYTVCDFRQVQGYEKTHREIFENVFDKALLDKVTMEEASYSDSDTSRYSIPTLGFHDEERRVHGFLHGNGFFCFFMPDSFDVIEEGDCEAVYFADRGDDLSTTYTVGGEQLSVQQAADFAQEWIDDKYAYLEPDYEIKVSTVAVRENITGGYYYDIRAAKYYKGVPLENLITITGDKNMRNTASELILYIKKGGEVSFFTNGIGIIVPENIKKTDEVLSLSSVLDRLSATLADFYQDLPVSEIRLCRTLEPCYDDEGKWFYYYPGDRYKSRLVWEILIDIPVEDRPQSYKTSGRMVSYIMVDALTGETEFDIEPYTDEIVKMEGSISAPELSDESSSEREMTVEVTVKSYENEQLTFEYEGSSYTLHLPKERFAKQEMGISEFYPDIINNRYGIEIKAELVVNEDITEIKSCDVYTPNGKVYNMPTEFKPDGSLDTDYDFTFHKGEGSQCSFTNKNETVNADLNDLPMYLKLDYKDGTTPVHFDGFMFNDGTFMMLSLYTNRVTDAGYEWSEEEVDYGTCFIGTVGKIKNERTELTLADGRTKLDIPVSLNDGEVSEGMTVMAMIYDEPSVYGSGAAKKYDYALIFTHPKDHLMPGEKLDDMAYATVESLYKGKFHFVGK